MTLRRPFVALLLLAVMVSLVAGCSGDEKSAGAPGTSAKELLAGAKETIDTAESAHFTITSAAVDETGCAWLLALDAGGWWAEARYD